MPIVLINTQLLCERERIEAGRGEKFYFNCSKKYFINKSNAHLHNCTNLNSDTIQPEIPPIKRLI